jgi:single-strand DNA-binding protein
MYYNRIVLVGRLTRDPELRATPDGISVVRFRLAVNRSARTGEEQQTDFFDIVAFRQLADTVANYMTKGKLVLVEGKLHMRSYTDREGNRRTAYEIVADTVRFLERLREGEPEAATEPSPPAEVQRSATPPAPASLGEPEPIDDYANIDFEEPFDEASLEDDPFR